MRLDTENNKNNKIDTANLFGLFREGVLTNNPILIQLLGVCPTLATTTSAINGVGMGITTLAVLIFSNLFISLLSRFIPKEIRMTAYIIIISGFVTAAELILKAYVPDLDKSLGLFIPLIVVNCMILSRAENFASKNNPLNAVLDGLFMGLGFAAALFILSAIREIFGAGTFAGVPVMPDAYSPALIFVLPAGAFITLGCLIAAFKKLTERK